MKRLYVLLSLILLLSLLAFPAVGRADEPAPAPAEQTQPAGTAPDGWTWDEEVSPGVVTDGWTWDEV